MVMENQDLSRILPKGNIYYKVRTKCSKLSESLERRITVKEFLVIAASRLLGKSDKDLIKIFRLGGTDGKSKSKNNRKSPQE